MAECKEGKEVGAEDPRLAGVKRIDEVQVEVNRLVRCVLLDQVCGPEGAVGRPWREARAGPVKDESTEGGRGGSWCCDASGSARWGSREAGSRLSAVAQVKERIENAGV